MPPYTTVGTQDIERLKMEVDLNKKKARELTLANIKLSGIVKTGQDTLAQEQSVIRKLQEQLGLKVC